jgi:WD40 repeat protein
VFHFAGEAVPYSVTTQPLHATYNMGTNVLCLAVLCPPPISSRSGGDNHAAAKTNSVFLITGHKGRTVIKWNLATGEKISSYTGSGAKGGGDVSALAMHDSDGSDPRVIVACMDKSITVLRVRTDPMEPELIPLEGDKPSPAIAISVLPAAPASSRYNALACTAHKDGDVRVWDLHRRVLLRVLSAGQGVLALCAYAPISGETPRNPLLLTTGEDSVVTVWDLLTGQRSAKQLEGHEGKVNSVIVYVQSSPGSSPLVIAGGTDKKIVLWDLLSGKNVLEFQSEYEVRRLAVCDGDDGASRRTPPLIVSSTTHGVDMWDLCSGQHLRSFRSPAAVNSVASLAVFPFSSAAAALATTLPLVITAQSGKATVSVWNLNSRSHLHNLDKFHNDDINNIVAFKNDDGRWLSATADKKGLIAVWDHQAGVKHQVPQSDGATAAQLAVFTRTDKSRLLLAAREKMVSVWDVGTGTPLRPLQGHTSDITSIVVLENKQLLCGCRDGCVTVWDVEDGEQLSNLVDSVVKTKPAAQVAPKGVKGGKAKGLLQEAVEDLKGANSVLCMAGYTENKAHYAAVAFKSKAIKVFDVTNRKLVADFEHGTVSATAMCAVFKSSFSAPILVTASGSSVYSWNARTGTRLQAFEGHLDKVTSLCTFTTDDAKARALLLSGSLDRSVIVWDLTGGERLRDVALPYRVLAVAVAEGDDGFHVISCGEAVCAAGGATRAQKVTYASVHRQYVADYFEPPQSVYSLFLQDCATQINQTFPWNRIKVASARNPETFWRENGYLFNAVLGNPDKGVIESFFGTFAEVLPGVLPWLPDVVKDKSLLKYVLDKSVPVHHIVLDAWAQALQSPCDTFLRQMFHPCRAFAKNGLLQLSTAYPAEFLNFLCKLPLVKSHSLVHDKCTSYPFTDSQLYIIEGMKPAVSANMWSQAGYFTDKESVGTRKVVAYMVPLVNAADVDLLKAIVDASVKLDNMAVFEKPAVIAAFTYAWRTYGRFVHLRGLIRYALFLCVFTAAVVSFDRMLNSRSQTQRVVVWALHALVLLFNTLYALDEIEQLSDSQVRAQLFDIATSSKESLASNIQSLNNLFAASDAAPSSTSAPGTSTQSDGTVAHTPSATTASESSKVKAKRAKRGSVLDSIPAAPDSSAASATSSPAEAQQSTAVSAPTAFASFSLSALHPSNLVVAYKGAAHRGAAKRTWKRIRQTGVMHVISHFIEFWNALDLCVGVLIYAGILLRCANARETTSSRCVLALACVFAWFRLLYFMRPFKSSGLLGKSPP